MIQILEEFFVSEISFLMFKFIKISFVVFFIIHWIGCMMFAVANFECESKGKCWIMKYNLRDMATKQQYTTSLYYAMTTMCSVGYGDFFPVTTNERMTCMVGMILASGMYAFIISDIGKMVS